MSHRFCYYLITAIALFLVAAVSCAPAAQEPAAQEPAAQEPAAQEPAAPAAPAVPPDIQFFTWAEDDFEQESLEKLVEDFQAEKLLTVNLDVWR
jgi:ABC-type glycerol-3-phosphate transport system substrate-binding protein